jgi:hypothetical protein
MTRIMAFEFLISLTDIYIAALSVVFRFITDTDSDSRASPADAIHSSLAATLIMVLSREDRAGFSLS